MECRYSISFSCIVLRVISAIIINKPNDLFAHAKPFFTLIVLTCTTYGIQSSHKCYTEPYFVRLGTSFPNPDEHCIIDALVVKG